MAYSTTVPEPESEIRIEPFYENWREIAKVRTLFRAWQGLAGEIIVVNDEETGPDVASMAASTSPITVGGRKLGNFRPEPIEVTTSLSLQDTSHCGRLLYCTNSSAISITIELAGDPLSGVMNGFACTILRGGTGEVTISSSSLTNRHPDLHTSIVAGLAANVFVDGNNEEMFFFGGTEL